MNWNKRCQKVNLDLERNINFKTDFSYNDFEQLANLIPEEFVDLTLKEGFLFQILNYL